MLSPRCPEIKPVPPWQHYDDTPLRVADPVAMNAEEDAALRGIVFPPTVRASAMHRRSEEKRHARLKHSTDSRRFGDIPRTFHQHRSKERRI